MSSHSKATQVYWQPLNELLHPSSVRTQELTGFDDEFIDIVDYIIRITHRIWEQKDIGKCYDYYAKYCPVHTLGGYCDDVDTVVQNTLKTIAAFPDRSLIGENVVWSHENDNSYYSSHRITSVMTNKGQSEFGAATGNTGRVTTIADCVCKDNRIVYEWLMRDNSFLVKQLGIAPISAAQFQANLATPNEFDTWITQEFERVEQQRTIDSVWHGNAPTVMFDFATQWLNDIFNRKHLNRVADFYHLNCKVQWPGGRRTVGVAGVTGLITQWLAQSPNAKCTLDHIAAVPFTTDTVDVAIRWSLAGTFVPREEALKECAGLKFFVLAATHLRIRDGKIAEEWTVFDEVAAMANLLRQQPKSPQIKQGASHDA